MGWGGGGGGAWGLLISKYLDEEMILGRVVGPLSPAQFPWIHCSPMGLVPKASFAGL